MKIKLRKKGVRRRRGPEEEGVAIASEQNGEKTESFYEAVLPRCFC